MSEEIKKFVGDFLVEQSKTDKTMQERLEISNEQRDRAVAIADGIMAWESLADTRKSMKDLAQLKQDIKEND